MTNRRTRSSKSSERSEQGESKRPRTSDDHPDAVTPDLPAISREGTKDATLEVVNGATGDVAEVRVQPGAVPVPSAVLTPSHRPSTPSEWSASTISDARQAGEPVPSSPPSLEYDGDGVETVGHPSFEGVSYVPVDVLNRVQDFALKTDAPNCRYSLGRIPADAQWGKSYKTDRVLCDSNNRPITVWILCSLRSKWFFDRDANPQPRVNVSGELPYVGDYDALCRLYRRYGCKEETPSPVVYASRFQTRYVKGNDVPTVVPFTAIYDAREKFRSKKDMASFTASSIGPGDIGLIEASFTRWKADKEAKSLKTWSTWEVSFELQSLSILFEAPAGVVLDSRETVLDVDDDM